MGRYHHTSDSEYSKGPEELTAAELRVRGGTRPRHAPSSANSSPSPRCEKDSEQTDAPLLTSNDSSEKRKRSRVTPEQLVQLERFFVTDRSPTAARRKEISDLLGMSERQTQIWFQNRRAKAKLQARPHKDKTPLSDLALDSSLGVGTIGNADLRRLIHEEGPITIIPCIDLAIGTWRRLTTTAGKHDLLAYVCETKRCIAWFICCDGAGFKMELPFDSILDTSTTYIGPGLIHASFTVSRPPTFFVESQTSSGVGGKTTSRWKQCADWTEDMQATKVLRHDLVGSETQLLRVLQQFDLNKTCGEISLRVPAHEPQHSTVSGATSMLIPLACDRAGPSRLDDRSQRSYSRAQGGPSENNASPNVGYHSSHSQNHIHSPAPQTFRPPYFSQANSAIGWPGDSVSPNYTPLRDLGPPELYHQIPVLPSLPPGATGQYETPADMRSGSPYDFSNSSGPPSSASTSCYGTPSPRDFDVPGVSPDWDATSLLSQPIYQDLYADQQHHRPYMGYDSEHRNHASHHG